MCAVLSATRLLDTPIVEPRMGDAPERLLYCRVQMRGSWIEWRAGTREELLAP